MDGTEYTRSRDDTTSSVKSRLLTSTRKKQLLIQIVESEDKTSETKYSNKNNLNRGSEDTGFKQNNKKNRLNLILLRVRFQKKIFTVCIIRILIMSLFHSQKFLTAIIVGKDHGILGWSLIRTGSQCQKPIALRVADR